ncbi:hypothetical protein [Legionella waltersii]|uniref:hypothetical protein n=1 Tax=Legionella waltersii TaxID=66969 RepID=UPI0012EE4E3D|nr:hypothetical protein [Legionella waltersii]
MPFFKALLPRNTPVLNPIICVKTQKNIKSALSLKITFQLNHKNIEWHEHPYPEIIFLEIINLETNEPMDYEHSRYFKKKWI